MKPSRFLRAALAVTAVSARAEVVDIACNGDGRFVHSGQIAAGKFVEVCGKLPAGLKVHREFETGSPVDFNVHDHKGRQRPLRPDSQR